jgi:hypothetical protein
LSKWLDMSRIRKGFTRSDPKPESSGANRIQINNNGNNFLIVVRFVQYFLVSGLDVNFGLEPDDANLSLDPLAGDNSPLERSYKPRILR